MVARRSARARLLEQARRPSTAMPSARPIAPRPSPRLGLTDTRCRRPSARAASTRRQVAPPSRRGAAPGAASSAATTTSTLSTHQPASRDARARRRASSSIETASRYCSSVAGNSVPRSGRPAGPSSASATACATASASEWPASPARRRCVTPPSTSGRASSARTDGRRTRGRPGHAHAVTGLVDVSSRARRRS